MHYFKKNLLEFSNDHIHLSIRANLKNLGTVLFLRAQGLWKSLSSSYSNVFIRNVHLFTHGWKSQIFSVLGKENNFILQYAAMFDKQNMYW